MDCLTIDACIASLATTRHGVFRIADLVELGVTRAQRRHRLESGRWETLYDGVHCIAGTPRTWTSKLLAATWAGGADAVASHRSAAALWELPGARRDRVEIMCRHWKRAREHGVVVHETRRLDDEDRTERQSVPVTTIERTLFDLAGVGSETTLDLAIDNALRRDLTSLRALEATLRRLARRGRSGSHLFRNALAERSPAAAVSESERETLLFRLLRELGLPPVVPQYEIRDGRGDLVARADFAYPDLKIAIEYDSYQEHTGKLALVRDSARRNDVVALGWAPISVTLADLHSGGSRLARTLNAARDRRMREPAS